MFQRRRFRGLTVGRRGAARGLAGLLVFATVVCAGCGGSKGVSVAESRVVTADIEDADKFLRLLGTRGAGMATGVVSAKIGAMAGGSGADAGNLVVLRNDKGGDFLLVKLKLSEAFMKKHDFKRGLKDNLSAADFELRHEAGVSKGMLMVSGHFEKTSDGESYSLPGAKIQRSASGVFSVQAEDKPVELAGDETYVRAPLLERLTRINPPTLDKNVWSAVLATEEDAAWGGAPAIVLFKLPSSRKDLKIVIDQDDKNAVIVKLGKKT